MIQTKTFDKELPYLKTKGGIYVLAEFEPLYTRDGELIAIEMLSRLFDEQKNNNIISSDYFFSNVNKTDAWEIFKWQLFIIERNLQWCISNQTFISLNINRSQAEACLTHPEILEEINKLSPWLRLEINEYFIQSKDNDIELISFLSSLCPLWLDDFGSGSANFLPLLSGHFEAIKVDKVFLWEVINYSSGNNFLKSLLTLSSEMKIKVILEGIESVDVFEIIKNLDVFALQGWLWPAVNESQLNSLILKK